LSVIACEQDVPELPNQVKKTFAAIQADCGPLSERAFGGLMLFALAVGFFAAPV
jgi:hypothetical protein